MPSASIGNSWARRIPPKPVPEPSASSMRARSARTRCTAPTRRTPRRRRSRRSFRGNTTSAEAAGGILLLWVCWKMYRELRSGHEQRAATGGMPAQESHKPLQFRAAVTQIILADLSMSLDNVLAVAGAAKDHLEVLVIGLGLSIL